MSKIRFVKIKKKFIKIGHLKKEGIFSSIYRTGLQPPLT